MASERGHAERHSGDFAVLEARGRDGADRNVEMLPSRDPHFWGEPERSIRTASEDQRRPAGKHDVVHGRNGQEGNDDLVDGEVPLTLREAPTRRCEEEACPVGIFAHEPAVDDPAWRAARSIFCIPERDSSRT